MTSLSPSNANDFIESLLDYHLEPIGNSLKGDILSFSGALIHGIDDIFRNALERLRQNSDSQKIVVVLETPGGYIEVVQRIVETLRFHYDYVDFLVPNCAFSAGTVFAMSGDAIYMDYYSRLGPIDPQVMGANETTVPALGYLVAWERLLEKARNGDLTDIEAQLMVAGFDQAELYKYEQARELSISLLEEWLVKYKFKDWDFTESNKVPVTEQMKSQRAAEIARALNDTDRWHSHGHGISMEVLRRDLKVKIDDFDKQLGIGKEVRDYYNLLTDYMSKRGNPGALHYPGQYLPIYT